MFLGFIAGRTPDRPLAIARRAPAYGLEPLEGRIFLSAVNLDVDELTNLKDTNKVPQIARQLADAGVNLGNLVEVSIPDVAPSNLSVNADGDVVATLQGVVNLAGRFAGNVPIELTLEPEAVPHTDDGITAQQLIRPDCPILNLELGPIHLDVLGLVVDTSEICLVVGANEGEGLLGDLLCGLSGLLDGLPIGSILGDLGGTISGVLNNILPNSMTLGLDEVTRQGDGVAGVGTLGLNFAGQSITQQITAPLFGEHAVTAQQAVCNILNLDVGPLDLNLLGLVVQLDNCDGGPVEIDLTAEPGPGNLLGNLLCGVSGILDGGLDLSGLNRLIRNLNRLVDRLL